VEILKSLTFLYFLLLSILQSSIPLHPLRFWSLVLCSVLGKILLRPRETFPGSRVAPGPLTVLVPTCLVSWAVTDPHSPAISQSKQSHSALQLSIATPTHLARSRLQHSRPLCRLYRAAGELVKSQISNPRTPTYQRPSTRPPAREDGYD
jgi:hypothetical protein